MIVVKLRQKELGRQDSLQISANPKCRAFNKRKRTPIVQNRKYDNKTRGMGADNFRDRRERYTKIPAELEIPEAAMGRNSVNIEGGNEGYAAKVRGSGWITNLCIPKRVLFYKKSRDTDITTAHVSTGCFVRADSAGICLHIVGKQEAWSAPSSAI